MPSDAAHPEHLEESHSGLATQFPPRTGRRVQLAASVAALVLVIAFAATEIDHLHKANRLAAVTEQDRSAEATVTVVSLKAASPNQRLTLPGETAPWYQTTLYARVNGYVGKWYVDIGDHVKRGQVLATIETPDLDAELAAAKAQLKAQLANVEVKQAEADFAQTTYARWRDSPKGVVSDQERASKKADFQTAQAQLNAAKATVNLNQANVDRLLALTQFKQVTAPFDGIVTERHIDIGNLVTAGSTASTSPLYRITQDDPIRVFNDVPQTASDQISVGLPVKITAANLPGHVFNGSVTRTANAVDPQTRTLKTEVDIPNPSGVLVPGLYVETSFLLKRIGRVEVPASALLFRSKGPQVAVIDGQQRVQFRNISIVRDDGDVVEVTEGVSPGDRVALNLASSISDGEKVQIAGAADDETKVASRPSASS